MLRAGVRQRLPWLQILIFPLPVRPHDVERIRNIPYGDKGSSNLLDVCWRRSHKNGPPHAHSPPRRQIQVGAGRVAKHVRCSTSVRHPTAGPASAPNYPLSPTPGRGVSRASHQREAHHRLGPHRRAGVCGWIQQ